MIKKLFSFFKIINPKKYGLAFSLVIIGFFIGRRIGWLKALRWAAMRYELKQAKEGLKNAKKRKEIDADIDRLSDDELDKLLLKPQKHTRK